MEAAIFYVEDRLQGKFETPADNGLVTIVLVVIIARIVKIVTIVIIIILLLVALPHGPRHGT